LIFKEYTITLLQFIPHFNFIFIFVCAFVVEVITAAVIATSRIVAVAAE
jgi:hypothetical protein